MRGRGKRDAAHHREPLGEGARSDRGLEQREGAGVGVGRRIGDSGDPGAREEASDGREIGRCARREPRPQPAIEAEETARGATGGVPLDPRRVDAAVEPEAVDRPRVQHPERSAPVLDAGGPVGDERVEGEPVERAGDRLVVADAAQERARRRAERVRRARARSRTAGGPQATESSAAARASRWTWWSCSPGSKAPPSASIAGSPARGPRRSAIASIRPPAMRTSRISPSTAARRISTGCRAPRGGRRYRRRGAVRGRREALRAAARQGRARSRRRRRSRGRAPRRARRRVRRRGRGNGP